MAAAQSTSLQRLIRRPSQAAPFVVLALAAGLAGCQMPSPDASSSLSHQPPPTDEAHLRPYAEMMADRYAASPDDKAVAMNYATALRRLTQHAQAVAVLQRLAVKHPHDLEILAAYGKALADVGRLQEAQTVLAKSHTPDRPNWSVLSAQGSVADQLGDHAQAQAYYTTALKIVPRQPQVLSNLGLSYALERRFDLAESTLRQATAQPTADMRERQNLALVLTVEGKYAQAEDIARQDLSPIDAAENVANMRKMVSASDTWRAVAPRGSKMAANAKRGATRTQTASSEFDR